MNNQPIEPDIYEHIIWVYTDGSAIATGSRTGAYQAMILFHDGTVEMVSGTQNWTTVNRMELLALINALYFIWKVKFSGVMFSKPKIQVMSDSMYVITGVESIKSREKNRDLWRQFEELCHLFDISIQHVGRNVEPPQAMCDAGCDQIRTIFLEWLERFQQHPKYKTFEIERNTSLYSAGTVNNDILKTELLLEGLKQMKHHYGEISNQDPKTQ